MGRHECFEWIPPSQTTSLPLPTLYEGYCKSSFSCKRPNVRQPSTFDATTGKSAACRLHHMPAGAPKMRMRLLRGNAPFC